jgi:hypothetical protein
MTRRLNVDGDGQGDLAGHGGEHRAVLGDARLRYFEQGIADPVMIANAHFSIRQSLDCKILSELALGKVVSIIIGKTSSL